MSRRLNEISQSGDMNDIREEKWHAWDIVIEDFVDGNEVDLADVKRITIGFGDGSSRGHGIVYFEDVRLCLEYPYKKQIERVVYDNPYHIMEQRWHVWNIDLSELTDVNAGNIKRITIGFGDGNNPYPNAGTGTVYFDDIMLGNGKFPEPEDPYDESPIFLKDDPFLNGVEGYPYFLKQDCPLIEAGYGYIDEYPELIGKTTSDDNAPDSGILDVGFHYPNWYYVNAGDGNMLSADLDGDTVVNFDDFAILADGWQTAYDINDLAAMAEEWLQILPLGATLNQEPNLVSDVLEVTLAYTYEDVTYYLLMDGQYFGRFYGDDIAIATYEFGNGHHEIKVVGVNLDSEIFVAPIKSIIVNNNLHRLTGSETYEYNQAYRFSGFYEPNGGSTISFEIKDLNDDVIWTNSSSGNFSFEVPAGILQSPYNELIVQEIDRGSGWIKDITKNFDTTNDPSCANAKSLLVAVKEGKKIPGTGLAIGDWTNNRKEVWKEYLNTCKKRGLAPTICLFFGKATRENIKKALSLSNVRSVMIISDGNREVNKKHRTFFDASDGPYFSYLRRNWGGPPGEYESLPEKYENGYSISDLKGYFHQKDKMYVFIDACKNGTSVMNPALYSICGSIPEDNDYSFEEYERTADMAKAFDIWDASEYKLYMGWRGFAFKDNPLAKYNSFLKRIWYKTGNGETFDSAISDAATYQSGNCEVYVNFSWVGNTGISIY